MAENLAWIKFFVGDWRRDPKVAMLSAAGRGAWLEMILTMHDLSDCKVEGTVREIARMCHLDMAEVQSALQELERHGVAEVTWRNDSVTGEAIVTVVSRRLEREEKTRSDARERQKKYRQKKKSQENNKEVPSDSDSDSYKNKEKVYKPKEDQVGNLDQASSITKDVREYFEGWGFGKSESDLLTIEFLEYHNGKTLSADWEWRRAAATWKNNAIRFGTVKKPVAPQKEESVRDPQTGMIDTSKWKKTDRGYVLR